MHNKDEEARKLAAVHYEMDADIVHIYRINNGTATEKQPDEPIKLLEVNRDTIPAGIMPLGFFPCPERGLHFPYAIVAVTPNEFRKIKTKKLKLPKGWTVGELLPRAGANGDE